MSLLFTTEDIRRIEVRAAASRAGSTLMERAGLATAQLASRLAPDTGKPLLVVAGPGNNGGDAWVAAAHLRESFHAVTVLDCGSTEPRAPEAQAAKARFAALGGTVARSWPSNLAPALIVDGLLGIGLRRAVDGSMATTIDRINACGAPVLSIDVPSGLDADTGALRGPAVRATDTITFIGNKPGLHTGDGLDCAGRVHVEPLGLDAASLGTTLGALITPDSLSGWLAPRGRNTHKGTFGTLGILGGNKGMVGAALLAARAGLRAGAGKVYVGLLSPDAPAFDPSAPELMMRPVDDTLAADVIVAGPGAGLSPTATSRSTFERSLLPAAIASGKALVLDADALNVIAYQPALQNALLARSVPAILTPHPAEAARLLNASTGSVQENRFASALELARRYNAHVVLKGAGSICASPDGAWSVNATGNPGLASGGTGDALAGMVGALLCQGLEGMRALRYGVCLHGAAADACVARGEGPAGLTASDVIDEVRRLLNEWIR